MKVPSWSWVLADNLGLICWEPRMRLREMRAWGRRWSRRWRGILAGAAEAGDAVISECLDGMVSCIEMVQMRWGKL
jgi:hypothetical protein